MLLSLYGTAVPSNLLQLNSIQNHRLCLATGCCKTSPATSLEVEANIFPLSIHRDLLTCQYCSKLPQLPNEIADNLLQAQFPSEGVSLILLPSMTSRARALFTNVNLQIPARNTAPLVSLQPLWFKFIPGHKSITGNEAADKAAKNAHLLWYHTLMPSSNEEVKNLTNTAFKTKWKTEWLRSIQLTGKGRHLLKIRGNTGQWPWSAQKTCNSSSCWAHGAPVTPLLLEHCGRSVLLLWG
ncbi:Ribonuclease H-like domain [Trinorchestia longiramus]|nr:Ribonuclease H-like domain [Trinorchestia longiramus]